MLVAPQASRGIELISPEDISREKEIRKGPASSRLDVGSTAVEGESSRWEVNIADTEKKGELAPPSTEPANRQSRFGLTEVLGTVSAWRHKGSIVETPPSSSSVNAKRVARGGTYRSAEMQSRSGTRTQRMSTQVRLGALTRRRFVKSPTQPRTRNESSALTLICLKTQAYKDGTRGN